MAKGKSFKGDGFVRLGENFSLSEKRMFGTPADGSMASGGPTVVTPFRKVVLLEHVQQTSLMVETDSDS